MINGYIGRVFSAIEIERAVGGTQNSGVRTAPVNDRVAVNCRLGRYICSQSEHRNKSKNAVQHNFLIWFLVRFIKDNGGKEVKKLSHHSDGRAFFYSHFTTLRLTFCPPCTALMM